MNPVSLVVNVVQMCLLDCLKLIVHLVSTHTHTEHDYNVHFKHLENSLALVYNFYSPDYNSCELTEGYDWKSLSVVYFLSCLSI